MNIETLDTLARAMRACQVTLLAYTDSELSLTLSRGRSMSAESPCEPVIVRSPGIGRLVPSHPQRAGASLAVGARVRRGTPLALLSDAGTLAAIVAPADGQIVEMLAAPGDAVGFGDPIVKLMVEAGR